MWPDASLPNPDLVRSDHIPATAGWHLGCPSQVAGLDACEPLLMRLQSYHRMSAMGWYLRAGPCAAAQEEKNLVIYIDGAAQQIALDDGGDRIPTT